MHFSLRIHRIFQAAVDEPKEIAGGDRNVPIPTLQRVEPLQEVRLWLPGAGVAELSQGSPCSAPAPALPGSIPQSPRSYSSLQLLWLCEIQPPWNIEEMCTQTKGSCSRNSQGAQQTALTEVIIPMHKGIKGEKPQNKPSRRKSFNSPKFQSERVAKPWNYVQQTSLQQMGTGKASSETSGWMGGAEVTSAKQHRGCSSSPSPPEISSS